MPRTSRLLVAPALAAASALALAGCAATAADDDAEFTIVASTSVYGQIAAEIGGDAVEVDTIITSAAHDPHEYEATVGDQLTVQKADLIVENGGGYDAFMDALVEASGSTAPVVVASEYSASWPGAEDHSADDDHDHVSGFNEHVWYDPRTMAELAQAIADRLSAALPGDASAFEANAQAFADGVADLESDLAAIDDAHAGERAFATEPVPGYLLAAAGIVDATPTAFSEAVEEGRDVPPATLLHARDAVRSGEVRVVIVNAQTGGAETTAIIDAADEAGIPVLEFSETLPDGQTYVSWMQQNIADLAGALG